MSESMWNLSVAHATGGRKLLCSDALFELRWYSGLTTGLSSASRTAWRRTDWRQVWPECADQGEGTVPVSAAMALIWCPLGLTVLSSFRARAQIDALQSALSTRESGPTARWSIDTKVAHSADRLRAVEGHQYATVGTRPHQ